jgi:hypothetical protein
VALGLVLVCVADGGLPHSARAQGRQQRLTVFEMFGST